MPPITYIYEEDCIVHLVEDNRKLSECIESIKEILKREHYKSKQSPFTNQVALNLDMYELKRIKRCSTQCTVDFVVGLKNNWLMPVEAKLDVKNVDNIPSDINPKIKHSLELLHSLKNYVHNTPFTVILLNRETFHQKGNKLKRLLLNDPKYVIHSVESFYKTYFEN